MGKKINYPLLFGLGLWLFINLVQSKFTLLSHDEAYYWMYSRALDWGYFDHPPAIALIIKFGYIFFQSELGVRLFTVLLSCSTLFLLYKICTPTLKETPFFFVIVFSIPLVHAGGFLATPDIPFIFFTTCFFHVYKRYSETDNWKEAFLLALIMAALMYSKYHGVLVIFFTILSNLNVLRRKSFWLAAVLSFLLFVPHLYWQAEHNFPSFRYHLLERSSAAYKIDFTLEYLAGQILILGPLTGIILLIASIKQKQNSSFFRALKFTFAGFFLFFFLSSFKSRVEANWTSAAFIPLIILSFNYLKDASKLRVWFKILAFPAIGLILLARIVLLMEKVPFSPITKTEFHLWDKWAKEIEEKAEGSPVVFMNSYQKASKYAFYTGGLAHTLNNYMYRKNQFDIWPLEDSLQGKKVFLIPNYRTAENWLKTTVGDSVNYVFIENFRSFNKVKIEIVENEKVEVQPKDSLALTIKLHNEGSYTANFHSNPDYPSQIAVNIYRKGIYQSTQLLLLEKSVLQQGEIFTQEIKFIAPETAGKYQYRVTLQTGWLPYGLNSNLYKLEVQ